MTNVCNVWYSYKGTIATQERVVMNKNWKKKGGKGNSKNSLNTVILDTL